MRIKLTSRYAGPGGNFPPGKELLLNDVEAEQLVRGGYAEYVDRPAIETAAVEPEQETAALPRARKRRRRS